MTTMASPTDDSAAASAPPGVLPCICPFCGSVNNHRGKPCAHCSLEDTPSTRQATKIRIGPWYVLQSRNPAAPGMKFLTLQSLIGKGLVTPRSVVRGPTTYQLWRLAAKVRGISREFGFCYSCGEKIEKTTALCPHCNRLQTLPADPDALLDIPQVSHPRPDFENPGSKQSPSGSMPGARQAPAHGDDHHHADDDAPPDAGAVAGDPDIHPEQPHAPSPSYPQGSRGTTTDRTSSPQSVTAGRPEREPPSQDLLTPQDLAKAFHLGYDAAARASRSPKIAPGVKWLITSVFLIGAIAALCYFNPSIVNGAWNWLQQNLFNSGGASSSPATRTSSRSASPSPIENPIGDAHLAGATVVAEREAFPQKLPATRPATQPGIFHFAATAAEVAVENSASSDARKLWAIGLDAESRRDFNSALKAYEQIESLPNDAWPSSLHTRIQLTREEVKAGTR